MARMDGKTCVVTGATGGIGRETALGLARAGAAVAVVGRDRARGEAALAEVRAAATGGAPSLFLADLGSLGDVRRLAADLDAALPRIDVLVNNAGAMNAVRKTTVDGYEATLAVNHLAPFLLTNLLLPKLRASAPARVVTVASDAHRMVPAMDWDDLMSERRYAGMRVYGQSKLANILFAKALAQRLAGTGVTSNALHPGVVATGFGKNDPGWMRWVVRLGAPFMLSPARGAATTLYLATAPEVEGVTGEYFARSRVARPTAAAEDAAAAERLWEISARLVGLAPAEASASRP
jgi:NAD(P)-dependent dehydrogenase (short-subunit alcohol dehydrogenase family)